MSSPPTPEELADQVIDALLADVHYEKTYPAHTAYYQFDEVAAKKRLADAFSTQRKKLLDEIEAAGPNDNPFRGELGYNVSFIDGFNRANKRWHAAIKALKERAL